MNKPTLKTLVTFSYVLGDRIEFDTVSVIGDRRLTEIIAEASEVFFSKVGGKPADYGIVGIKKLG